MNKRLDWDNPKLAYWFVSLLAIAFFFDLGAWGVLESSEARYADIARDMLESGHWFTPQLLGIAHMDKPLLSYWLIAIGQSIFGVTAFGARFFYSVAYLVQIVLLYKIVRQLFEEKRIAQYSAIIYATLPLVIISVRNITTDAFLNTFELLSIYFFLNYYRKGSLKWLYATFFAFGLTLFTKGPVGLLIPVLLMFPFSKQMKTKKNSSIHTILGIILMLMIGALWYIVLFIDNPQFIDILWEQQVVQRVTDAEKLKRSKPFYYYLLSLFATLLPWIFLLRKSIQEMKLEENKMIRNIAIFWIAVPFLFFSSVSSKLILYVLPLVGGFAIWFAYSFHKLKEEECKWINRLFVGFYGTISVAVFLACFALPMFKGTALNWSSALILLLGVVYVVYARRYKLKESILLTSLVLPLFIIPASGSLMRDIEADLNGLSPISEFIEAIDPQQEAKVITFDRRLPSITFATGRQLYNFVYQADLILLQNVGFESDLEWKKIFIDLKEKEELKYAKKLVKGNSILIVRRGVPGAHQWINDEYTHQKKFGKWTVLYK